MFCINTKINSLENQGVTKKLWDDKNLKGLGKMLSTAMFCQRMKCISNKSVVHKAMWATWYNGA